MIIYSISEVDGPDDVSWDEIPSGELKCIDDAIAWLAQMERYERRLEERANAVISSEE